MISKNTKLTVGMNLRSDKVPERTFRVGQVHPLRVLLIPTGTGIKDPFREATSIVKNSCTLI